MSNVGGVTSLDEVRLWYLTSALLLGFTNTSKGRLVGIQSGHRLSMDGVGMLDHLRRNLLVGNFSFESRTKFFSVPAKFN